MAVVCFLLVFIMLGTFVVFGFGTRGFYQAVARVGAVGEVNRLRAVAGRDLSLTHFNSVTTEAREVNLPRGRVRRDGVALAALSDWTDEDRFYLSELPKWDRWVVLYATTEEKGRLLRLELESSPPLPLPGAYSRLRNVIDLEPGGVAGLIRSTTLSEDVYAFEATSDRYLRVVRLRLLLWRGDRKRMTSETEAEEFSEALLEISPMNSYPEL